MPDVDWYGVAIVTSQSYTCGYCGRWVASNAGYYSTTSRHTIRICSFCALPTYFEYGRQTPGVPYGEDVDHLPDDIAALYNEARQCMAVSAHTAAVLVCRKILMNVAVDKGASEGQRFIEYVEYLNSKGYVPPDGRGWVDHIRSRSNDANHEIALMRREDGEELITFVGMLLKLMYEFPARRPPPPSDTAAAET